MSDLISREALLKSIEKAEPINLGWITDQITNAPSIGQDEVVVDYLEIENISQMAGLLVDTPRGLAWEFADIEKLTKFANICEERRYFPNTNHVGVIQHLYELNDAWISKLLVGTKIYTKPQYHQSVADALEEAAKIVMNVYVKPTAEEYGTLCDARDSIRALIKRNAKEGE